MNPNLLSADVKAGRSLNIQVNDVAEPGGSRVGAVPGEGRDLDQEEQQFANLLHRPCESTGSPVDSQPSELSSGRRLESPFSIPWASLTQREETGDASAQMGVLPLTGEKQGEQATSTAPQATWEPALRFDPSTEAPNDTAPPFPTLSSDQEKALLDAYRVITPLPTASGKRASDSDRVTTPSPRSSAPEGLQVTLENSAIAVTETTLIAPQPSSTLPREPERTESSISSAPQPSSVPSKESGRAEPLMTPAVEKPVQAAVMASKEELSSNDFTKESPSGDRILQSLLGQPPQPIAPSLLEQTPSLISSSDRMDQIDQLAERLAQRILVSDRTYTTDSEVRIQLRESVLQGAEITLRHDQGQLVVTFNVAQSETAQVLSPQTDDLQRALTNKLNESVRIEVNVSSQSAGDQDSPGDGRSRNRRDPRDEWGMEP